ncbi:hypothetical protein CIHG_05640 [Coccidioides immitis H538.4]|uniref:Uncharacterized protein n=3 Tax=Coccidioides immitis TaxID=5501 RepID=A0A0J8R4V0_COCIT|nr:hypothetical protein CIRG_08424 [Coccidioides immitis RMSCC 2394]KMU78733.1 hypothetical protein CISG_01773 [Coccidioides immitis RMSCC 3703]KMU87873.1 hypothetical protein CIHG_05640 [Coccidioides immitis H538.4]
MVELGCKTIMDAEFTFLSSQPLEQSRFASWVASCLSMREEIRNLGGDVERHCNPCAAGAKLPPVKLPVRLTKKRRPPRIPHAAYKCSLPVQQTTAELSSSSRPRRSLLCLASTGKLVLITMISNRLQSKGANPRGDVIVKTPPGRVANTAIQTPRCKPPLPQ